MLNAHLALSRIFFKSPGSGLSRVGRRMLLKSRETLSVTEALTMRYIAQNTTIPVPRIHGLSVNRHGHLQLLMEYVDAPMLEKAWPTMLPVQKRDIMCQLKGYINQLRLLEPPHPGVVEAVDGSGCRDFRIRSGPFGPFRDVEAFHTFLGHDYIRTQQSVKYQDHQVELDRCARRTYKTVFTHADLAPHNILVKDGMIVAIIDWEFAGWYPEYWEYTRAYLGNLGVSDWWELFSNMGVDVPYPDELVVERILSNEFVRC